jgi:ureidoacrylate peracid hydrolase
MRMTIAVDKKKTAFLALDMQNEFVHEKGKFSRLGVAAHTKQTNSLINASKVIDASRKAKIPVIYVRVAHKEGYPELPAKTSEMYTAVRTMNACLEGSWGTEILEEVKPHQGEPIVTKTGMNAFHGTNLENILRGKGVTTIVLAGMATNFVVEATARHGNDAGYEVVVLSDCCASVNEEMHKFSLKYILPHIATISNSSEFIKALR